MKFLLPRFILCLTAALLPGSAFAELNNKNNLNVDGLTGCKNDGFTPEEECKNGCGEEKSPGESAANEDAKSEEECDDNGQAQSPAGGSGSSVHNGRLELHVPAMDFSLPSSTPGCGTCGTDTGTGNGLASVKVERHLQSRFTVENSSFGRASGLAGYDVSLSWKKGWMLSVVNNYYEAGSIMPYKGLSWANDTQTWRPTGAARTAYGLTLFDATGNPITALANRDLAHTGVLLEADGKSTHFQFICRTDNTVFGRPVAFADRNGNLVTVEYVNTQPAFGTTVGTISEYFRRTKITDPYDRELLFEYQLQGSSYLVSKITHPDGQFTTYNYANLSFYGKVISSVNHPDGSTSTETWTRNNTTGLWETVFFNATAPAGDRVIKAFISGNSGKAGNGSTVSTTTGLVRRVDNGVGEMTYANRIDTDGKWLYYNGGKSTMELQISGATKGLASEKSLITTFGPEELQEDFFTMATTGPESFERKSVKTKTNGNNYRETSFTDAFGRIIITPTRQPVTLSITRSEKSDGTATTYAFNQFDRPVLVTDRLGRVTKREYDFKGNVTKVTRGFGTPSAATTEYLYNAQGLVSEERDPLYDSDFPELHNTRYEYDANNYPEKIIHSADTAGGTRPETLFDWDPAGRLASVTDPLARTVAFAYDNRSRLVTTTYDDTSTETVEYGTGADANLVISRTDRNGNVTEYEYDAADRVTLTRSAAGLPEEITEACEYLLGTRLKSSCIMRGEKTEYEYDYRNRLIGTARHADANTALMSATEIDILGRRRSSTDPYGRRTFYLYDQNDRIARTVTETVPGALDEVPSANGSVPAFSNSSSQTAEQIEREITLTNGEEITLRRIHEVTYTDARDLFLNGLTRDLSPNAPYLITDRLTDAEGQTLTTTDARGIETLQLHDSLGRTLRSFEAITLPEERLTETDYDDASNVTEIRMPRHFAETEDDGNGGQVGIRAVETYTYTGRNLRKNHTVAAGHPTLEATQSWVYNLDGTVKSHTDFRNHTDLTLWRVCCRRLQAYVDRDGASTSIQNNDFKGNIVHTATTGEPSFQAASYDFHNPTDSATLAETTTRFDGLDRPTATTAWLQPLGDVLGDCCGGTGEIPIATDPAQGLTTTITYDEDLTDGQGIDQTYAAQFTALTARGVTFNANANGFASAVTNAEGETSVSVQDGLGRTVMTINPEGHIQTIRHDEMLPAGALTPPHLTAIPLPGDLLTTVATDALGHATTTYSDGAGRTLLMEDAAGFLSGAAYDANSNRVISRDPNGLGEDCEFDNLNRDIECADLQEQAENTSRTKTYNAHNAVLTATDAEGEISYVQYDVRDRTESTTDANSLTTTYGYDENGNRLSLTDPKNATRSWTYEERNLKLTKTMPDANDTVSYTHDALRRLKVVTQQDSSAIEMVYDLAGRMTSREYSDSTTDTFGYDDASRLVTATKGRHEITVNRSYHDDGTMASESYVLDGRTYRLEREYYADNNVASQKFADNKVMEWDYDARNLVTDARYDGDLVLEQDYDAGARLVQQAFGNDLTRDITYGRPDNMRTGDTVSDTGIIDELSFTYGYAPDKNVLAETQINGALNNLSFNAGYDAGNRVTSYNRTAAYVGARETQSWDYDGAGNWDSTVIDGDTQNRTHSDSDQLEVIAGDNLTYDPRGNQLTDNRENEYEWDIDNRIVKSEGSGYTDIEYRYDALGRRIVRKQGSDKEVLLWWGNTEQSEHKHQAGQTTIQNDLQANPSEQALNTLFARALEGSRFEIQYFHKNYLDHVMAVSDDNGNLIEHYRYTAFGEPEIYAPNGTRLTTTAIDNDILWNVRRYESANGLYMYLYRDYDAASGRWPSRDPIGERGGMNLYGFVNNDGVNRVDILGNRTGFTIKDKVYTGTRIRYTGSYDFYFYSPTTCICKYFVTIKKEKLRDWTMDVDLWETDPADDAMESAVTLEPTVGTFVDMTQMIEDSTKTTTSPPPSNATILKTLLFASGTEVEEDPVKRSSVYEIGKFPNEESCPYLTDTVVYK